MTGELCPVNHCGPESKPSFVFDERVVMVPRGSLFSGEFVRVSSRSIISEQKE